MKRKSRSKKSNFKIRKKIEKILKNERIEVSLIAFILSLFAFSFLSFVFAFNGPTQNPPGGNGILQVDTNGNFGIASSLSDLTPAQGSFGKVFTVASSSNPALSVFDVNDAKRFTWYIDSSGNLKLWYNTASSGGDKFSVSGGGAITSYGPIYSANNTNYYIDPGLSVMPYSALFSGNVGIGTTAPASKLQVVGSGGVGRSVMIDNREIKFRGDGVAHFSIYGPDTGKPYLTIQNTSADSVPGTVGTDLLTITSGGNVGIGTTSPNYKLDINGSINISGGGNYLRWNAGDAQISVKSYGLVFSTWTGSALTEKMRITSAGDVGIGTTAPSYKLDVNGGLISRDNSSINGITFNTNGSWKDIIVNGYNMRLYSNGNTSIYFNMNYGGGFWFSHGLGIGGYNPGTSSNLLVNGNVGIGTTTPAYKLDVQGGQVNSSGGFCIAGDCKTSWSQIQGISYWALSGNYLYPTSTSYKVGIATSTPSYPLTVVGSGYFSSSLYGGSYHSVNNTNYYIDPAKAIMPYSALFSGNVGIGTTAPGAKLEIVQPEGNPALRIESGSPIDTYWLDIKPWSPQSGLIAYTFDIKNSATTYNNVLVLSNSNVGIGTTNPSGKLEVSANTTRNAYGTFLRITNTNTDADQYVNHRVSLILTGYDYPGTTKTDVVINKENNNLFIYTPSGGGIGLQSSQQGYIGLRKGYPSYPVDIVGTTNISSGNLYVSGNVGIGTTTPAYKLDVQGGQVNSSGGFCIAGDCKTSWSQIQGISYWALSGNYLYPTSTSYKVGIATSTPSYPLTVVGSGYFSSSLYGGSYHSVNNTNYYIDPAKAIMPYSAVLAGDVGIGVTNPLAALDISGAFYSRMVVKGNCSGAVTIDWSQGNTQHCVLTGNVTFTFINGRSGGNYRLILKQDSVGGRGVTWPSNVRWGAIGVPSLSVVPTKTDYVGFIYNGVDSYYDGVAFNSDY